MKQGWEIKKLGEVCTIERGGSPRPIQAYITESDDGINWIKIGDATDGSKYITSTKEKIKPEGMKKSRFVHKGDFILSNSMSFGRPYILAVDGCIHDGWLVIHDDNNRFDKNYLYYYLGSPNIYNEFKRLAVGGVVNNLNSELVRSVNVCIPPLVEQERIVAELDCLSGVIEKKKQQLKELDALAQSIFYQMFGDPITNEKGWNVKKLEELCDIINGFAFPSSDFAECNPIKVIKITNVGVNEFISDDSSLPEDYNNMEGCKVHTGDIVIALTRTIISAGVKRAIVPNEYNESLVNQRVAAILANDRIVSRRFLYSFLGTDFVRQYILQKATALMQPNLSIRDLRDMPTIYPPLTLQQEFAEKIEEIEKQKELIKQSIIETETLFNARMDYYFN